MNDPTTIPAIITVSVWFYGALVCGTVSSALTRIGKMTRDDLGMFIGLSFLWPFAILVVPAIPFMILMKIAQGGNHE